MERLNFIYKRKSVRKFLDQPVLRSDLEEILKAADKAGLALAAVIMLCLIAIHGAVFHVAYGWYANRYYHKKFL